MNLPDSEDRAQAVVDAMEAIEEDYETLKGELPIRKVLVRDSPNAEQMQIVCDNLNIHDLSALYETLEPAEARSVARRIRLWKTPKQRLPSGGKEVSVYIAADGPGPFPSAQALRWGSQDSSHRRVPSLAGHAL